MQTSTTLQAPPACANPEGKANAGRKLQRKLQNKVSGDARYHLTVSQAADANPLVKRYISFCRTILKLSEQKENGRDISDVDFSHVCKAFYLTESIKTKSGKTILGQKAKLEKQKGSSQDTGRVREQVGKTAQNLRCLIPSYLCPNQFVTNNADVIKFDNSTNTLRSKLHNTELRTLAGNLPAALRGIVAKMALAHVEDKKILTNRGKQARSNEELKGLEGKTQAERSERMFSNLMPFWNQRWTITATKQFLSLRAEEKLCTLGHANAALKVYDWLSREHQVVNSGEVRSLNEKLVQTQNHLNHEALQTAQQSVHWTKSVNLGRIHPRIMALTLHALGAPEEVQVRAVEIFGRTYFAPILSIRRDPEEINTPDPHAEGDGGSQSRRGSLTRSQLAPFSRPPA